MNRIPHLPVSATRRLARVAIALVLPVSFCAAAAEPAKLLLHRFVLAETDEWVSIELRPTAAVWHQRWTGGPTARVGDVRTVLGSLKGIAIGARCRGRTEGPVHYPCAFELDVRPHADTATALHGWTSTTTYKLERPEEGTVSALSTPGPQPGSIVLAGESGLLALIAPPAMQAQWAADRPLRLRVRLRLAPATDDSSSAEAARREREATLPAQGAIVISTQPLRVQSTRSALTASAAPVSSGSR